MRALQVGPANVELSAPFLALQRFFVGLHARGILICLCSRNAEPDDVLRVWRERGDEMVLKLEHVVAHTVSWERKSAGLVKLATSLCVGVDSLVLVDDSSAECAEVSATLPHVGVGNDFDMYFFYFYLLRDGPLTCNAPALECALYVGSPGG